MTQPTEAVGGDGIPADANPATPFEDIAKEMLGEDQEEEEDPEAEGDEPTAEEDDIEVEAEELPPIDAPVSLSAEDKEAFKNWPRDAQELFTKRVGEMEKGFHTKAQEAAQARSAARNEALQYAAQLQAETAQQLERYAQQLTVSPPDASLYASDPYAYAQQLQAYQHYTAQSQQAQREAEQMRHQQAQYEAALAQEEQQSFVQQLQEHFPEYLDPQSGPQLARDLSAIAAELGYPAELISQARPHDILAMKKVADLKVKADKYDKAMAKQMERVRQGKGKLPPVSTPGVSKGAEGSRKSRADAAWQTAKTAKSRPAKDGALATWMENSGWL